MKTFDEKRGKQANWQVAGPLHTTRNCWVFKAEAPEYPHPLAVKIYRSLKHPWPVHLYTRALKRYRKGLDGTNGVAVPAARNIQPDNYALVLDWVDGKTLRQVLLTKDVSAQKRAERIEQCGVWLRRFHKQSDIKPEPLDTGRMAEHTGERVAGVKRGLLDRLDADWIGRAVAVLERQASVFHGRQVLHGVVHGDFTTSNLLVSGETIYGLDFEARRRLPLVSDVSRFLVHLDVCKPFLTPRSQMDETAGARRDVEAFKAGYGDDLFPDADLLRYAMLNEIVRRIAIRRDENASQGPSAARYLELYRLRRRCKILVTEMEAS